VHVWDAVGAGVYSERFESSDFGWIAGHDEFAELCIGHAGVRAEGLQAVATFDAEAGFEGAGGII
jgi:hypothetical protein